MNSRDTPHRQHIPGNEKTAILRAFISEGNAMVEAQTQECYCREVINTSRELGALLLISICRLDKQRHLLPPFSVG